MVSSSLSLPKPVSPSIRPTWTLSLGTRLRGLSLAREKGWLFVWDENHWVHLFDPRGKKQGQVHAADKLAAVCPAEDGSGLALVGRNGQVWWLAPDLSPRSETTLGQRLVAAAVDPFGQYLALADGTAHLHILDRRNRPIVQVETPRPLHHLSFVPALPLLVGGADYGLVACYDLAGNCTWRDGLVAHIGSLACAGEGDPLTLACFSEGLVRYSASGAKRATWTLSDTSRLAALSFDGRYTLAITHGHLALLLDEQGQTQASYPLSGSAVGLALAPLANEAYVALTDGTLLCLDLTDLIRPPARP